MPLDAVCLSAVAEELRAAVIGARIDKIQQPAREELILALRSPTGSCRLLLSGGGVQPRAHLTNITRENPAQPPMFCMLLRRHIGGARILSVSQPPMERVLSFALEATNELGDKVRRTLVLEALGRRGAIVLLDEDGRILDCARRQEGDLAAGQRGLMPGLLYRLPPKSDKENPLTVSGAQFTALLAAAPPETEAAGWLTATFGGLSPLIAREIAARAAGRTDARVGEKPEYLAEVFMKLMNDVKEKRFTPVMLVRDGQPVDYSFTPVTQYGSETDCKVFETFGALLDEFYAARERAQHAKQRGQDVLRTLKTARERVARKLANQSRELASAEESDTLRRQGDLLTAYLHLLERGQTRVRLPDYYDPDGGEAEIVLDPLLTPQQNAAKYYKRYNKAKTAARVLAEQIERGREELGYLDSVIEAAARAEGESDFLELRQELEQAGYLKPPRDGKKRPKTRGGPMEFRSGSGLRIQVGRNNLQNDALTRSAGGYDLWLHVKGVHGAHVILRAEGGPPDDKSVEEAACLAAYFSEARESGKAAVDVTPAKFVKKPAAARPGMVIYHKYETVYVSPRAPTV